MSNCQCSDNSYLVWLMLPIMMMLVISMNSNHAKLSDEEQQIKDQEWKQTQIRFGNFLSGYGLLMGIGVMGLLAVTSWTMRNKPMAICCGFLAFAGYLYMNGYIDLSSFPVFHSLQPQIDTFPTDDQLVVIDGATE